MSLQHVILRRDDTAVVAHKEGKAWRVSPPLTEDALARAVKRIAGGEPVQFSGGTKARFCPAGQKLCSVDY
jgi:hypothetical protein